MEGPSLTYIEDNGVLHYTLHQEAAGDDPRVVPGHPGDRDQVSTIDTNFQLLCIKSFVLLQMIIVNKMILKGWERIHNFTVSLWEEKKQ